LLQEAAVTISLASERRSLTNDELEPVLRSHHPAVADLSRAELVDLARWLRARRDRARDILRTRRRVASGKVESRGTVRETASEYGMAAKKQVFANALKRVNARLVQIEKAEQREAALARMQALLASKRVAVPHHPQSGQSARAGMRLKRGAAKGRVIEGARIGSVSQSVRNAQAGRDRRGK
jgi:hypothetical protein